MQVFTASHGRFQHLKRRPRFHSVQVSREAASADAEGARAFKQELQMTLDEKYLPEQKVSVDETSLFWKSLPERACIHQESKKLPGFKAFGDCSTPRLGGNVAGFKLKPLPNLPFREGGALENVSRRTLPIYCHHSKKAWPKGELFEDLKKKLLFHRQEKTVGKQHPIQGSNDLRQCSRASTAHL